MSTQSKALLHAEWLERSLTIGAKEAANELRRLHKIEQQHDQLLNLVKGSRQLVQDKLNSGYDTEYWQQILYETDAAIAACQPQPKVQHLPADDTEGGAV